MKLRRRVRRFFCDQDDCSTGPFVEQIRGLTARHAQRTTGVQHALVAIALALAERAGSRLATVLGMSVSGSTLLRQIPGLPDNCGNRRRQDTSEQPHLQNIPGLGLM